MLQIFHRLLSVSFVLLSVLWYRKRWGCSAPVSSDATGDASGSCRVPGWKPNTPGTLEHLATGQCNGLSPSTNSAIPHHWITFASSHPHLLPIHLSYAKGPPADFLTFLLDPSTQAPVISLTASWPLCDPRWPLHAGPGCTFRARYRALGLWSALSG